MQNGSDLSLDVVFNSINVNAMDTQSGIFIGENTQNNWSSQAKQNSGFGMIEGEGNIVFQPWNYVFDPDYIDNPSIEQ